MVGLAGMGERLSHTLSGGQKQRAAIAGALAQLPKARQCSGSHAKKPAVLI